MRHKNNKITNKMSAVQNTSTRSKQGATDILVA